MEVGKFIECIDYGWEEPSHLWNQRPIEDGLRFALCRFDENIIAVFESMSAERKVDGLAQQGENTAPFDLPKDSGQPKQKTASERNS
jgi:hypothetical protein